MNFFYLKKYQVCSHTQGYHSAHLLRVHAGHSLPELVLRPQEVRPGDDDGRVKLADSHVKHAVPDQSIIAGETGVSRRKVNKQGALIKRHLEYQNLLRIFLSRHEDLLAGDEPEPGEPLLHDHHYQHHHHNHLYNHLLNLFLKHQWHGPAQLVIEEPKGVSLKYKMGQDGINNTVIS